MNPQEIISLVDHLRAATSEKEWFEFKQTHVQPSERLGEYFSALANSAALAHQPYGYLVLGVHDKTHAVTGTPFDYRAGLVKGNQDLWMWTLAGLTPSVAVDPYEVQHPEGRLVVFRIAAARDQPVAFYGTEHVRVNSHNQPLAKYPAKRRALWNLQADWSAGLVPGATLDDLDPDAIAKARAEYAEKNPKKTEALAQWDDATFLNKALVTIKGEVTRTALLLLGLEESAALLSPAVAQLSWFLSNEDNAPLGYEHFGPPFILNVDRLLGHIRNLTLRELPGGTLFPKEIQQYDDFVIREALHNAIAHQDYTLHARVQVVESPTRLLMTNRGRFIPDSVEEVIERDAPPDLYRNPFLVRAMVNLNMIDTEGGGIRRMFTSQARRFMPLPSYDISDPERVVVTIPGAILEKDYTRLLMRRDDLTLLQVFLLDKVQKGEPISKESHQELKALGLVEGRYPNLIVSGKVARVTGQQAEHVLASAFDNDYYRALILKMVREYGPVSRAQIDALLLGKLPSTLSTAQQKSKIHDLLSSLSRPGKIKNIGTRRDSQWVLGEP